MNVNVQYQGRQATVRPQETVLEAFLRQGFDLAHSCRAGSCQQCLVQCVEGQVPADAARHLPAHLQTRNYLLACQCRPQADMVLQPPNPQDQQTDCMLLAVRPAHAGMLWLQFETAKALDARAGQWLQLAKAGDAELELQVTQAHPEAFTFEALAQLPAGASWPQWLHPDAFGVDFAVRGPLDAARGDSGQERSPPPLDPGLWAELDNGRIVRAVLDDFYAQVYQDPDLSPFFRGVTQDRAASKQYAFLWKSMTGEDAYFGDRPRNAHHRMVITDALFDKRQALMEATLRKHGLDEVQIARWTRYEVHYRSDMVKREPWPRLLKPGELQPLDGYVVETLQDAMLCDHCGDPVEAGVRVLYHQGRGQISCPKCAPEATAA